MTDLIQIRRVPQAYWAAQNIVPAAGEPVLEIDTGRVKSGDGVTAWADLPCLGAAQSATVLNFASVATPTPPGSGLDLFTRRVANRRLLGMMGPGGVDTSLQPALFGNRVFILATGSGTALSVLGGPTHTAVGTVSTPALDASSFIAGIAHTQIASAATAGSVAHQRVAQTMCYRGDAVGRGGWFYRLRFGLKVLPATRKGLFGLAAATGAIAGSQVPSALAGFVGVGWDEGQDTIRAWSSRAASGHTLTDTGIAVTQGWLYELTTFCPPAGAEIGWRLDVLNPGAEDRAEGTLADEPHLPLMTTFLAPHAWLGNSATASAVHLAFSRLYIETDF